MDKLFTIDMETFKWIVAIVSLETVGIVEWLKNKKKLAKLKNHNKALLVTLVCAIMQFDFISVYASTAFNIIFCSLAITQLSWTIILQGVPTMLGKAMGVKAEENKDATA